MSDQVITRFAPSPTGDLHLGGARTALFNWLYAKKMNGKFLLRMEDTDLQRSKKVFETSIIQSLEWLGLKWNDAIVYQSSRKKRHQEIAEQLLKHGNAYYCRCSKAELEEARKLAVVNKQPLCYNGKCRNLGISDGANLPLRLKVDHTGSDSIVDLLQGKITVNNDEIDDMIILRSDGSPTYMLSVVVDDYDMKVSHIIRGDDHLTNAFRQNKIYQALGWQTPLFCHVPLIHGRDGSKLSKRHGATCVVEYKNQGILPQALFNALLRLSWAHGNDEIISQEQAISWFDFDGMSKGAARFDPDKLSHLNHHYIKKMDNADLLGVVQHEYSAKCPQLLDRLTKDRLLKGLDGIKQRSKTLLDIAGLASIYFHDFKNIDAAELKEMFGMEEIELLIKIKSELTHIKDWQEVVIEEKLRSFAQMHEIKLGKMMGPLRLCLSKSKVSPSLFEIMAILGRDETLRRIAINN